MPAAQRNFRPEDGKTLPCRAGDEHTEYIYSFKMVGGGTGMALRGWLGGGLFDLSGDYTWSLWTSLIVGAVGVPLALSLPRHRPPAAPCAVQVPA